MATHLNEYCKTMLCAVFFLSNSIIFVHIHISYCVFGMKNIHNLYECLPETRDEMQKHKKKIAQHIIVVVDD